MYDDVLRELQQELLALMPERIEEFRSALALVRTDAAARVAVQRIGHRLAGTAATVGLDGVGLVGRAIERFAKGRAAWSPDDVARAAAAVDALAEWTAAALASHDAAGEALSGDPRVAALRAEGGAP